MIRFRVATRADVAAIIGLLTDDRLGKSRETLELAEYEATFDRMASEPANTIIVGEAETGEIVATYQITFILGLSLNAARRAQVESVRVASSLRGQGIGKQMFDDVFARARAAGCSLVQLTMNSSREDANRFYKQLGFEASHTGFKYQL